MPRPRRAPRQPHPRGTLRYDKLRMALDALVDRLAGRGLAITDRDLAPRHLRQFGATNAYTFFVPGLLIMLSIFGAMFAGFSLIGEWREGVV